jgi:hypothetical protein
LNEDDVGFPALFRAMANPHGKRVIFTPYSTHQIDIWRSIHQMQHRGAAHLLHVAAPLSATALLKKKANVPIQYTPNLKMVPTRYTYSVLYFL